MLKGPRTLLFIFGKSDGWWSKTFSHGDGANVDPATRLVCLAFGSWRLLSRNDETSHESEVHMRDSAEKLLGRFAPHFLLYCASLFAELEFPCVANALHDMEGLLADAGDSSVLVHDGGPSTTRQQPQRLENKTTSKQWGKTKNRETKMHTERMNMSQFGVLDANPSLTSCRRSAVGQDTWPAQHTLHPGAAAVQWRDAEWWKSTETGSFDQNLEAPEEKLGARLRKSFGKDLWCRLARRSKGDPRKLGEPKAVVHWLSQGRANKKGRSRRQLRLSTWTLSSATVEAGRPRCCEFATGFGILNCNCFSKVEFSIFNFGCEFGISIPLWSARMLCFPSFIHLFRTPVFFVVYLFNGTASPTGVGSSTFT